MRIDAKGMHYRPLNKMIRNAVASDEKEFELDNVGDYVGTGMHGGVMYIRGKVGPYHLGKEVSCLELNEEDGNLYVY